MKCQHCKLEFPRLGRHTPVCKKNPERDPGHFRPTGKPCQFCGREFKFLGNHSKYCKLNENREIFPEERRRAVQEATTGVKWSKTAKEKHKIRMQQAVLDHPASYSGYNRWKRRAVKYGGHLFHSAWEVRAVKYFENAGIDVRPNQKAFNYEWKGSRRYTPDLYLPRYKTFVEVKGWRTERDECKWRDFPGRLLVVEGLFFRVISKVDLDIKPALRSLRKKQEPYLLILHTVLATKKKTEGW